jgi:hypothetical protein
LQPHARETSRGCSRCWTPTSCCGRISARTEDRGSSAAPGRVAGQALFYSRLGLDTRPALVNGALGGVSTRDGEPFAVGGYTIRGGKIVEIDILADPERLRQLDLTILDD